MRENSGKHLHPRAAMSVIRTYLRRHSRFGHTPEGRMWIECLSFAWNDARSAGKTYEFFGNGHAQKIADLIGFVGDIKELFLMHAEDSRKAVALAA